uniref:Uncharacterized protein n=1 Tax=Anopheles farauti TaxID=69004 RepID=A0A182QLB5_9DIPT
MAIIRPVPTFSRNFPIHPLGTVWSLGNENPSRIRPCTKPETPGAGPEMSCLKCDKIVRIFETEQRADWPSQSGRVSCQGNYRAVVKTEPGIVSTPNHAAKLSYTVYWSGSEAQPVINFHFLSGAPGFVADWRENFCRKPISSEQEKPLENNKSKITRLLRCNNNLCVHHEARHGALVLIDDVNLDAEADQRIDRQDRHGQTVGDVFVRRQRTAGTLQEVTGDGVRSQRIVRYDAERRCRGNGRHGRYGAICVVKNSETQEGHTLYAQRSERRSGSLSRSGSRRGEENITNITRHNINVGKWKEQAQAEGRERFPGKSGNSPESNLFRTLNAMFVASAGGKGENKRPTCH